MTSTARLAPRLTKRWLVAAVLSVLVAASVLAACGDDSDDSGPGAASQPTGGQSEAPGDETASSASAGSADDTVEEAGESESVDVQLLTSDGETLHGVAFGPASESAVVLAHMRGAGKETWYDFAGLLAERGIAALAFDFRGYGESSGERDTELDTDIAAAVDVMRAQGADEVYVIGASMGGTGSVVAASELDLAGVATLSAPAMFGALDAEAAAGLVDEPALHIVAVDDQPYADDARTLAAQSGGELVVVDGSAHGTNLFDSTPDVSELLMEFVGA